ncbi:hypothetical protein [Pseudonocardia sp. GCM10023141]|uniref:hypothetical protein n=1 Tax=Pseudonocardia sp. GCM10023141 TaxID=3252653 RepID=UPI0036192561
MVTPMSGNRMESGWSDDLFGMSNQPILEQLAELSAIPPIPNTSWRGATLVLFAANPIGITTGYLQVVKDISWQVPDAAMLRLAIDLLQHRHDGTTPHSGHPL